MPAAGNAEPIRTTEPRAMNAKQIISERICALVEAGATVPQAVDAVLGEGTFRRLADELWEEFNRGGTVNA